MKGSFLKKLVVVIVVFVAIGYLLKITAGSVMGDEDKPVTDQHTILQLDLNGVILNGKKFLTNLDKYKENKKVKAVLVNINSPGGSVGPSQELYTELKRVRDELKKPVVCVATGVIASGAYYTAMGCNKLVVAPGALVGSIGVIMEFANIEKLYDWAKISRYSITSGKFKDSGAEYRTMRDDEKALFQNMIDEVYAQFKETVKTERKVSEEIVSEYADGRVFTGATAVKIGLADQVGFYKDAVKLAAELAGLGDNYEVFKVNKQRSRFFDFTGGRDEDDVNSLSDYADILKSQNFGPNIEGAMKFVLRTQFLNQPLLLMPGYWE